MEVKFLDLRAQYARIKEDVAAAVSEVMESGDYILGRNVAALEEETARYLGAACCAGTASGTDSILLALRACGVSPGDEVVTTPFTFAASIEAVLRAGAKPVFCDIEPVTFNMDPSRVRRAITARTAAILPVHLYGMPADMREILDTARERGLKVVEDAAQSFGADYRGSKAGTLGDAGCFSFFPSKTLGAFGDAGMVATGDREICGRVKLLSGHGIMNGECVESGYNSRLDELQAAILRVKLKHVEDWISARREAAARYARMLADTGVCVPPVEELAGHSFNYFVVKCERRDELARYLSAHGIGTGVYYPAPAHLQKAFRRLGFGKGDFPVAEELARRVLALPIYPEIPPEQQAYVAEKIKLFYEQGA